MAVANPIIVASRSGTFEWLTMPRNAMSYKGEGGGRFRAPLCVRGHRGSGARAWM